MPMHAVLAIFVGILVTNASSVRLHSNSIPSPGSSSIPVHVDIHYRREIGVGAQGTIMSASIPQLFPGKEAPMVAIKLPIDTHEVIVDGAYNNLVPREQQSSVRSALEEVKVYQDVLNSFGADGLVTFYGVLYTTEDTDIIPETRATAEFVSIDRFDSTRSVGFLGIVMETCNHDLSSENLYLADRIMLLKAAVITVARLHEHGYLHRDLKSENIMVCNRRVKLIDFGMMHHMSDMEKSLDVIGTPESILPRATHVAVDESTDGFALAVTLVELSSVSTFWIIGSCNPAKYIFDNVDPKVLAGLNCIPEFSSENFIIPAIDGISRDEDGFNVLTSSKSPHFKSIAMALKQAYAQAFTAPYSVPGLVHTLYDLETSLRDTSFPDVAGSSGIHYELIMTTSTEIKPLLGKQGWFTESSQGINFRFNDLESVVSFSDALSPLKSAQDIPHIDTYIAELKAKFHDFIMGIISLSRIPVGRGSYYPNGERKLSPILSLTSLNEQCIAIHESRFSVNDLQATLVSLIKLQQRA